MLLKINKSSNTLVYIVFFSNYSIKGGVPEYFNSNTNTFSSFLFRFVLNAEVEEQFKWR